MNRLRNVTDLERFSLEEVWRPYWPLHPDYDEKRLMTPPMNLERTARELVRSSEWSDLVIDRLAACGVSFRPYVVHPLVDVIRARVARHLSCVPTGGRNADRLQ